MLQNQSSVYIVHTSCTRASDEHICQIVSSYSVPKLRYGARTLKSDLANNTKIKPSHLKVNPQY